MNILFAGGGWWGSEVLDGLTGTGNNIFAVVKLPRGHFVSNACRKLIFQAPLLKRLYRALRYNKLYDIIWNNNIKVIFTPSINDGEFINKVLKIGPDLIVIASFDEKLESQIISAPKLGCINCHPSLLPRYRGPDPFARVILNKENKTGITFHMVDSGFDTGDILIQKEVEIENDDTAGTLSLRCGKVAGACIKGLVEMMSSGKMEPKKQASAGSSYYPELREEDYMISWDKSASDIYDLWRSAHPWHELHVLYRGEKLYLSMAELPEQRERLPGAERGSVISVNRDYIVLMAADRPIRFNSYRLGSFNMKKSFSAISDKVGNV